MHKARRWNFCIFVYSCTWNSLPVLKENKSIKDLDIFDNLLLYRVYADNTAFF